MDAQRRAEITDWDAREFSGGFSGLRPLADRGFSGAVTDGMGWLFLFEGRVVGTADTDLDAFADASGTVYEAPHESLPVLFAMQEQGGEPRAQYYTNDTPLSEADRKLSQGGFTGYIELSENVLSGDYYVTYTAGESKAAAYVGNSRRLETGDDAFALADDEVGIYTVYEVDLNVSELPDTDAAASGGSTGSEADERGDETRSDDATEPAQPDATEPTRTGAAIEARSDETDELRAGDADEAEKEEAEKGDGSAATDDSDNTLATDDSDNTPATDNAVEADVPSTDEDPASDAETTDSAGTGTADRRGGDGPAAAEESVDEATADPVSTEAAAGGPTGDTETDEPESGPNIAGDETGAAGSETRPGDEDVFSEEAQWREQKSIPALDPSDASPPPGDGSGSTASRSTRKGTNRSDTPETDTRETAGPDGARREQSRSSADATDASPDGTPPEPRSTERRTEGRAAVSQGSAGSRIGASSDRLRALERDLDEAQSERDALKTERDEVAAERDELAGELDALEREVESLRSERDRLREELSEVRTQLPDGERTISAAEARSGTNLFVRYESKGGATLEDAHDGAVDRDALRENLRIEHHTSFETEDLLVDGRPFEEFLTETIEYGFTRWLVEDLPFEVSSTGNQSVLADLYDALPEVDRAEIGGSVSIAIRENGEETREQRTFDLVLRDRMGNPLFVADLNDSRDPTAEGALESLVSNGRDIAESNDSFAAAFAVTESFFEPGALETASGAVGGGLFSRSKRASFVKLSRKQGYHLCLVEARDGGFHMTVPDL